MKIKDRMEKLICVHLCRNVCVRLCVDCACVYVNPERKNTKNAR